MESNKKCYFCSRDSTLSQVHRLSLNLKTFLKARNGSSRGLWANNYASRMPLLNVSAIKSMQKYCIRKCIKHFLAFSPPMTSHATKKIQFKWSSEKRKFVCVTHSLWYIMRLILFIFHFKMSCSRTLAAVDLEKILWEKKQIAGHA